MKTNNQKRDFIFACSTNSFQIEGGRNLGGRTDSIWDEFTKRKFVVLPAKIQPIPIIFHWDTPLWAQLQGGWENPEILNWFRNYCKVIFEHLGKYTDLWYVNDENSTFTLQGYLADYLPPARNDKTAFAKAIHNLNMSAAIAKEEFELAKKKGYIAKEAMIGVDHDWTPAIAYDIHDAEDIKACDIYNEWFLDFWLDPNFKGTYPKVFTQWLENNKIDLKISKEDLAYLKSHTLDFIGWNYYRPCYVTTFNKTISESDLMKPSETFFVNDYKVVYPKKDVRYTDWKWVIDPQMLEPGAKVLYERYQKSLMIVENGLGSFDNKAQEMILDVPRIEYLKEHLAAVLKAKENGVDFIGYSMWTYCDIFSPSGGYRKDYGLVSVDFNSPIRERKPKLSYSWYKQVIKSDGQDLSINIEKLKKDLRNELDNWDLYKK